MICKNCGASFEGNYCFNCGEKKYNSHDLSVSHFFEETLESFLHLDNKFLRSVKKLMFSPGELSVAYTEGARVKYMRPLQLFLVVNLLLFIMPANPLSLSLENYIRYTPFINYDTQNIVQKKIEATHSTLAEYSHTFNEKIKAESKAFVFLFIPFYAVVFCLLFMWYRKNIVEHLVFASHFMSFYMLLSIGNFLLLIWPFYTISHSQYSPDFDIVDTGLMKLLIAVYVFFATRKFYRSHLVLSIAAAALTGYFFFDIIQYYRMLLFFKITHG